MKTIVRKFIKEEKIHVQDSVEFDQKVTNLNNEISKAMDGLAKLRYKTMLP